MAILHEALNQKLDSFYSLMTSRIRTATVPDSRQCHGPKALLDLIAHNVVRDPADENVVKP